ncbi:hypothetical protein SAMN02745165_01638 [Malonomonas rubra DSM 5091]|uniref:Uncharacterized protein n=1 Tax=Malonomonas rubra DSM 5091 TaxID=1122189 RepID=A0A1M6GQY0_MALRU|nr:hypothetical protein [Malonomonas rubra]SHJ12323.1 hypothetical protein SAMN02745165_01638 [Malonomonas rubra DSM 5091]
MAFFRRSTKINVVYKNGVKDRISPSLLGTLIDSRQIDQFERSDGWAKVGLDPIRGAGGVGYDGAERRLN